MAMKQYITRFLRFCEYRGLDQKTISRHRFNLDNFTDWLGRKQITKETLREFILYSKNRKARTNNGLSQQDGLSIHSVNSFVTSLKRFVYYLWSEEKFLQEDLSQSITSLPPKPFMPTLLTPMEIYSLINCPRKWGKYHSWIDRRKYDFFFELLACMGLRKFEALGLKVADFDFDENVLRITYAKGNKSRLVPIPKALGSRLKAWFEDRGAKPTDWAFRSRNGTKIGYSTFKDELTKRARLLNIKKRVYMHLFRHCFITELIKAESPALKVARIVGHSSLNTTMRYTHLVVDDLKETIEAHPLNKRKEKSEIIPSYFLAEKLPS
jgi:site-specific recombinase XerD